MKSKKNTGLIKREFLFLYAGGLPFQKYTKLKKVINIADLVLSSGQCLDLSASDEA